MAKIEIDEAAVKALEKFGITADMLKDGKTKELGDAASTHFEKLNRERIKNEVEQELKEENDTKVKEAIIGAHNASKEKLIKLAKKRNLELPKDDLDRADFNKTLDFLNAALDAKKEGADGKDAAAAELAQAREQLEKANELIANYKTEVEAFPTKLEAYAQKVQKDLKVSQMRKDLFESFKDKADPSIYKNEATRKAYNNLFDEFLAKKGIVFDAGQSSEDKESLIPKTAQKDRDGKPLVDKNGAMIYIPAAKDNTSNYDAPTLLEQFFKENDLIATQLAGANNQIPNNTQNNSKPNQNNRDNKFLPAF